MSSHLKWAVIIMILALWIIFSTRGCIKANQELKETYKAQGIALDSAMSGFISYRDNVNRHIITYHETQISKDQLINLKSKEIEELRAEVKKISRVKEYTKSSTITTGSISTPIKDTFYYKEAPKGDSIALIIDSQRTFNYEDKWLTINGELYQDSISLDYQVRNEYKHITEWVKPPGLFKHKTLSVKLINENPNTEVTDLYQFTVKPEKKPLIKKPALYSFIAGLAAGAFIIYKTK